MNLLESTNTYGFSLGSAYPKCLDQGKVCLGGGVNGDWAGSAERALQMASWLKGLGFTPGSQKRSRKLTASGNRSDHWDGSKDSYGVDLPCRGEKGNNGWKKLRDEFVSRGWISKDKMPDSYLERGKGKWINFNVGNYRYQVGWNVADHYDHIHVGVRNTKPEDKYTSPTDDTKDEVSEPTKVDGEVINKLIYTNFSSEDKKIIESVLSKLKTDGITNVYSQIVLISIVLWKLGNVETSDDELDFINELPAEIKTALKKVEDCFDEKIIGDHLSSEKKQEGVNYYPDNGGVDSNAKKALLKLLSAFALKYPEVKSYDVVSDYRSYDKQVLAFCKKSNSEKKISERQKWSALPGFSQHSTGKTFDLFSVEPQWWDARPELKNWLKDNASDYGFKISYPSKGTLRESEPWHIYYVGGSIKESVEMDSDVEGLIGSVKKEDFKSLDEALTYFDKKLESEDFNKEEVRKIAEKFEVSINGEDNKKSEISLDKLKQFFKKFDEIYGEKNESSINHGTPVNEDIDRMKNIMKKIL